MATIGALVVQLSANHAALASDLGKAERRVKSARTRVNRALFQIEKRFWGVQRSVAGVLQSATSFRAVAGTLTGAAGLGLLVKRSLDTATEIHNLAQQAGVGTTAFQELTYAAGQYGVSQDALVDGLKELSLRVDEFVQTGAGPAEEALKRLGFTDEELRAGLKNTDRLFAEVIRRMEALGDTAATMRIADELFGGTGGEQFVRIVNGGSDALERLRRKARDLGLVIKDDLLRNAKSAKDQLTTLATVLENRMIEAVVKNAKEIDEFAGTLIKTLPGAVDTTVTALQKLIRHLDDILATLTAIKGAQIGMSWGRVLGPWGMAGGAILGGVVGYAGAQVAMQSLTGPPKQQLEPAASQWPPTPSVWNSLSPVPSVSLPEVPSLFEQALELSKNAPPLVPGMTVTLGAAGANQPDAGTNQPDGELTYNASKVIANLKFRQQQLRRSSAEQIVHGALRAAKVDKVDEDSFSAKQVEAAAKAFVALTEKIENNTQAVADSKAIIEATRTAQERYNAEVAQLDELFKAGRLGESLEENEETYNRHLKRLTKILDDATGVTAIRTDAKALIRSVLTPQERIAQQLARSKKLLDDAAVTQDLFEGTGLDKQTALTRIQQQADDALAALQPVEAKVIDLKQLVEHNLDFTQSFDNMAKGFARTLQQMLYDAVEADLVHALFGNRQDGVSLGLVGEAQNLWEWIKRARSF